jgi:hypothetical protein
MREVSADFLRDEVTRLRALVTQSRVLHGSGIKLHDPGASLTPAEIRAMQEAGVKSVFLLEPGETEPSAQKQLTTEAVEPLRLAVGDVLAEDVRGPEGELVLKSGTPVDGAILRLGILTGLGPVRIRRRVLRGGAEQAASYLALVPPAAPRTPRPDSRLTRASGAATSTIKPLLAPRARILVTVNDDFQRSLILNTYASDGHEVFDRRWADVSQGELQSMKPDVLLIDLAEAPGALATLRKTDLWKSLAILVAGPESRRPEIFKAISGGANGSVLIPPKREALLEKLRGTIEAFGRRVNLRPALQGERRTGPREGGHLLCTMQDKFLRNPLPVSEATVLDVAEGGLRIEYARREGPHAHAYMAHAVHPQHVFFNYAKDNPLGRDLTVSLPPAKGRTLEGNAKFVHVSANGEFETAGLVFQRMKSSVRDHMTAVRGGTVTPSTARKSF